MIIWAILIIWAHGVRSNHRAENVTLQTFQEGDEVTIKCFSTKKGYGKTMVWYKLSAGQIPRPVVISYNYLDAAGFKEEFKNGRFDILGSEEFFHLKITAMTKNDTGMYYCGTVFLNLIEFISGTHLMLKGTSGKIPVANRTASKNTDSNGQKVWDPLLLCLISSNVVFVIAIITLLVDYCKRYRKRQRGSKNIAPPSREIGNSDVTYAAVRFAAVPPARRSNNRHLAE